MKVRRFYPTQVARDLHGRDAKTFSPGECAAVGFFFRKGRRLGAQCAVLNEAATADSVLAAPSRFYFGKIPFDSAGAPAITLAG